MTEKRENAPRFRWLVIFGLLISLLIIITACGGDEPAAETNPDSEVAEVVEDPTDAPLPPTNTPEPLPTDTPIPDPTATPEPTAEPTAEPTPVPPTATPEPADLEISEGGLTVVFPAELEVTDPAISRVPANESFLDGSVQLLAGVPEFIKLSFLTDQGPGELVIQPIRDETGTLYASMSANLRAYFQEIDVQIANESEGRIDQQQLAYIPFVNGNGLRAVSYEFPDTFVARITNQNIYYYYDGVTSDGRYYVALKYPVDAEGFTPDGEFTDAELAAAAADFNAYVIETMGPLDQLGLSQFDPNLELLDQLVASIEVAPDASTTVSNLADCVYDAEFVSDVTIDDASIINPGEAFEKIWRVRNSGTCGWDSSFTAAFIDGNNLNWTGFVRVDEVAPGEEFDIAVDLRAPEEAGIYEGRWQMIDPLQRPFGIRVYVTIVVPEAPVEPTPVP